MKIDICIKPNLHTKLLHQPSGEGWREKRTCTTEFFISATKQCHCFDNFTQNISQHNLLKMVLLHSHSRVGGNNRAHFEPETIYIVTVGAVPSQLFGCRAASAHMHVITHTLCSGVERDRLCLPKWRSWLYSLLWLSLDGLHVGDLVASVWFAVTQC